MPDKPSLEDNASLRSFMRNAAELGFTTLMWALWIYLFMPLLSLVLWVVGLPYIYKTLFAEQVFLQLMVLLERMGCFVLMVFLLLRGWGLYNYYVFGKRNRRRRSEKVTPAELSLHFGITAEDVYLLQQSKEIVWVKPYDAIRSDTKNETFPSG